MPLKNRLVFRYILGAIAPYFLLALALLTVALIAQQTTKFTLIVGGARAPLSLAAEISAYLLPNVLVFTLPMATLVGTVIGMGRLGSDSELVAMRAAGFGTTSIVAPTLVFGALASVLTFYISFEAAPSAAQELRQVAIRAALRRLESPVEPRSFYTDLPGKVVYVREGDLESGQWNRVFIYWKEGEGQVRLVTARSGRIDSSGERAELVLQDAVVTTLEAGGANADVRDSKVMSERSEQLRMRDERLDEQRRSILGRLQSRETELDEMEFGGLYERSRKHESAKARLEAGLALHKRVALSLAAVSFSFLGAALGLRARRGGRGLGMLLSLVTMVSYYLALLWGEHLARTGWFSPSAGAWVANVLVLFVGCFFMWGRGRLHWRTPRLSRVEAGDVRASSAIRRRYILGGLMDRTLVRSVGLTFLGALVTLTAVFLIFTLFELLRFIAANSAGARLIPRYLFFLLPLISVALAPMSVLVAVLFAYALLARRSEAVAWWASGQSTYRLAAPAILFSLFVGFGLWAVQEGVLPYANRRQDSLRAQIRGGEPRTETAAGRHWLVSSDTLRIYSYQFEESGAALNSPEVYEFDKEGVHVKRVSLGGRGEWEAGRNELKIKNALVLEASESRANWAVARRDLSVAAESPDVFKPVLKKPSEMDARELSAYLKHLRGRNDAGRAPLAVALERKKSDPFSPLVMALIGIPLAFAFGKRSSIAALCAAVGVGLLYWAAIGGFQQLGNLGVLPPAVAAWVPAVICASIGIYLLSRSKT